MKVSADANKMSDLAKEANAVTGKEYDGTSAENLTKAFEQIYNTITTTAKIRAYSITDTLSQWVDPVDFADVANGTDITRYVTVTNNGTTVSGYTAVYNVDDNGNRTITVTFNNGNGMIVDKNETIDVSFKAKPSDAHMRITQASSNTWTREKPLPAMNPQESKDTSQCWSASELLRGHVR
ncbi:MAG: hypothetical protein ACLUB5_00625 [Bifidobacterium dentium]